MKPRPLLVVSLALAVLLLVPLWWGYGLISAGGGGEAHDAHGGGPSAQGSEVAAFVRDEGTFMTRNTGDDGCVRPSEVSEPGRSEKDGDHSQMEGMEGMEGMDHGGQKSGGGGDGHGSEPQDGHEPPAPVVYIQAVTWTFLPQKLCLDRGETYTFKMMATDVTHGLSIHSGPGSRVIRLPAGQLVEQKMRFRKPGEYLVYCSFYCGIGHPVMSMRIYVT